MKNKKKYRLVILTTHFGTNFSGGSTATHEIFSRMQRRFKEIIVICNQLGQHSIENLILRKYKYLFQVLWILITIRKKETLYYGDFYNSIWFVWLKIPFYFTYHDNWPEQGQVSLNNKIKAVVYNNLYKSIFRNANCVITVSSYKIAYIKKYNSQVKLVRNGFKRDDLKSSSEERDIFRIIMVGNIDRRKYSMAVSLFKKSATEKNTEIHVYGNQKDKKLSLKLKRFKNVRLMGFAGYINYCDYDLFLHTSMIENLPISICEALYHEVPVIAFNVGGIPEIVNNSNGILVEPFQINKMFNLILQVKNKTHTFSFEDNDLSDYSWDKAKRIYEEIMVA